MWRAAAACAVALLLAAGCGGEEKTTTTWSENGVSFEYPATWKPIDVKRFKLEAARFAAQGPADKDGERLRVALFRDARKHATSTDLEHALERGFPFALGSRHVRRAQVHGAEAAFRVTLDFTTKEKDGSTARELVELAAMTKDEEITVEVGGVKGALEADAVEAIFDSFTVR